MTKRLLDCTASELSRFTSRELLGSIAGCEGRVLACETIGVTPPLPRRKSGKPSSFSIASIMCQTPEGV